MARSQLAGLLGLSSATGVTLPFELPTPELANLSAPEWQAWAAEHRPEERAALAQVEAAQALRAATRGALRATQPTAGLAGMRESDGMALQGLAVQITLPVFDTGAAVPAEALFLDYQERGGGFQSPEVFPRADGTTYVCAISSESPLPLDPNEVGPDPGAIERLEEICRQLSPVLAKAPIVARQACFRPVTQDGLPLIGRVPALKGVYVATGHSVWGILNAPATGEAVTEVLLDGAARNVDLAAFDPARLPALDPKRLSTHA